MKNVNLIEIVATWRSRIKKAQKTEEQVAAGAGIHKGQLSLYLNAKNLPGLEKFEQIENYLRGLGV